MRKIPIGLVALTLLLAATPAQVTAVPDLSVLGSDAPGDQANVNGYPEDRVDLVRVSGGAEPEAVWFSLETRAAADAPDPVFAVGSELHFKTQLGTGHTREYTVVASAEGLTLHRADGATWAMERHSEASAPWNYVLRVPLEIFVVERSASSELRVHDVWARTYFEAGPGKASQADRLPDSGYGSGQVVAQLPDNAFSNSIQSWAVVQLASDLGTDYGARAVHVAGDRSGNAHVSYLLERQGETVAGPARVELRYARVTPYEVHEEVVEDDLPPPPVHPEPTTATQQYTQTRLAVEDDGTVNLLYFPDSGPTSTGEARVARLVQGAWTFENPLELADGSSLQAETGYRSLPEMMAGDGRVVVMLQERTSESLLLLERGEEGWSLVERISDARHPHAAMDSEGVVHLAFFRPEQRTPDQDVYRGQIVYTNTATYSEQRIVEPSAVDMSEFWDSAGPQGGFDVEVGDDHSVWVTWVRSDQESRLWTQRLDDDAAVAQPVPLHEGAQEPQYRVETVLLGNGDLHAFTGYGTPSDLHGVRSKDMAWGLVEPDESMDWFEAARLGDDGVAVAFPPWQRDGTAVHVRMLPASAASAAPEAPGPTDPATQPDGTEDEEPTGAPLETIGGPGATLVAVAALGAVGLAALAWTRGLDLAPAAFRWMAPLGLFSRLREQQVVRHRRRAEILQRVELGPGSTTRDVRRDVGQARSTFFYHLRRLEDEGKLRTRRQGAQLLLFPPPGMARAPAVPPQLGPDDLLAAVRDHPFQSTKALAARMGVNERTIRHWALTLWRQRRIERRQVPGKGYRWVVNEGH